MFRPLLLPYMNTLNVGREKPEESQDVKRQNSIADYRRRTGTGYQLYLRYFTTH